jgi:transcription initiation factor TFIIIB Brf1 subunit/transcription initiation factor TFIIB
VIDISGTDAVGENLAGSVASLVECRDWNGATEEQKLATLEDVRGQVDRPGAGISVPSLTDEEAQEYFDKACEPEFAQGFRLYKLYARAVALAPLARRVNP